MLYNILVISFHEIVLKNDVKKYENSIKWRKFFEYIKKIVKFIRKLRKYRLKAKKN